MFFGNTSEQRFMPSYCLAD